MGAGGGQVDLSGPLTKGAAGSHVIELENSDFAPGVTYTLLQFASTDFTLADFAVEGVAGQLTMNGTSLQFTTSGVQPPPRLRRGVQVSAVKSGKFSVVYTITNSGNGSDQFRIASWSQTLPAPSGTHGGGHPKPPRVTSSLTLDGVDVQNAAKQGGALSAVLAPGASSIVKFTVHVDRPLPEARTVTSSLSVSSVSDPTIQAQAGASIKLKATK